MVLTPAPGMLKLIVSVPALALAALIASRKVQPLAADEHKPSSASAAVFTTKVMGAASATVSAQRRKCRGAVNQPVNTRSRIAPRTRFLDGFLVVFIALSS